MEASFHTGFLFAFYFKVLSRAVPYLLLVNSAGLGAVSEACCLTGAFYLYFISKC